MTCPRMGAPVAARVCVVAGLLVGMGVLVVVVGAGLDEPGVVVVVGGGEALVEGAL